MWHRTEADGDRVRWPDGRQLVRECEAFMSGRLAEEMELARQPVPSWAWINMLAHGSPRQLRLMAGGALVDQFVEAEAWERGLSFLAREVLAVVEQYRCGIEDVQHQVLVPLELEMTDDPSWVETGPSLLVVRVVAALAHYRGRTPR